MVTVKLAKLHSNPFFLNATNGLQGGMQTDNPTEIGIFSSLILPTLIIIYFVEA